MLVLVTIITVFSISIVLYHHIAYPLILKKASVARKWPHYKDDRCYKSHEWDSKLPSVTLIVPAFHEEEFVAQKIYNLATLDYPKEKLKVLIYCDGCEDDTYKNATEAKNSILCSSLDIEVKDVEKNRGKVSSLNRIIPHVTSDIVGLSDVSALLSVDSLLIAAKLFQDEKVGVVAGTYDFLLSGSDGEKIYWNYQRNIKKGESALGGPIGAHGAFYMFKSQLFSALEADTVNDDFIIPMQIMGMGYRAVYEPEIMALELEQADLNVDFKRRCRIAQGNIQQVFRLKHLLHPKHKGVAFTFVSGKVLRAFMPIFMIVALIGSFCLTFCENSIIFWIFGLGFLGQALGYSIAMLPTFRPNTEFPKAIQSVNYLVSGYIAGLVGIVAYCKNIQCKTNAPWKRVH